MYAVYKQRMFESFALERGKSDWNCLLQYKFNNKDDNGKKLSHRTF